MLQKHFHDYQANLSEQDLNNLIFLRSVQKSHKKLLLVKLPIDKYVSGVRFWDNAGREFYDDSPCSTCVIVHNNWIVGMEAKRYRFREMHMWFHDGGYYR